MRQRRRPYAACARSTPVRVTRRAAAAPSHARATLRHLHATLEAENLATRRRCAMRSSVVCAHARSTLLFLQRAALDRACVQRVARVANAFALPCHARKTRVGRRRWWRTLVFKSSGCGLWV